MVLFCVTEHSHRARRMRIWGSEAGDRSSPSDPHLTKPWQWTTVNVELPVSDEGFPPGNGVEAATSYCLICHSAGMVLRQPPLTRGDWRAEIVKMRSAYGAPIPDDQVGVLADYLAGLFKQP